MTDGELRNELLAMAATDQSVRAELVAEGTLFQGYHPRMAAVHHQNAVRLSVIMDRVGWPTKAAVGSDALDAAWLVLQHSIGDPPVMRRGLELLLTAPSVDVNAAQVAMLEDRIRVLSGLRQRYGTQFDWDANGNMNPQPIEDPEAVDERRRAVGLGSLAEKVEEVREGINRAGARLPTDFEGRRHEIAAWERSVGWHE